MKRIGILTSGGDCQGLNSTIRAVGKSLYNYYGSKDLEIYGIIDGYRGLIYGEYRLMKQSDFSGILTQGGTILGTSRQPFKLMRVIDENSVDKVAAMKENYKKLKLDCLVILGGNGTQKTANLLSEEGLNVVSLPKTIDNDLSATDFTFGFDSALSVATDAVDRIHTTAESHHRVMILETMGRYAGWIALRSCIAGGGDICLIPEIPYSDDAIVQAIEDRQREGKTFSIIVAAEGAVNEKGEMAVKSTVAGSTDPIRLGGISGKIAAMVEERLKVECRVVVLGHLQRGGTPTAFDRWLSTRFGTEAVELILQGKTGYMVALRGTEIVSVPVKEAVSKLKRVDPNGEEVRAALAVGTSFGSNKVGEKCGV